jgi:hypothetical protein
MTADTVVSSRAARNVSWSASTGLTRAATATDETLGTGTATSLLVVGTDDVFGADVGRVVTPGKLEAETLEERSKLPGAVQPFHE